MAAKRERPGFIILVTERGLGFMDNRVIIMFGHKINISLGHSFFLFFRIQKVIRIGPSIVRLSLTGLRRQEIELLKVCVFYRKNELTYLRIRSFLYINKIILVYHKYSIILH